MSLVHGPRKPIYVNPLAWVTPPTISGITRNELGAVLGNVTLKLFRTIDDALLLTTTSDPSTGAYAFYLANNIPCYVVAYLGGAPDVAGTTVNTLTAV